MNFFLCLNVCNVRRVSGGFVVYAVVDRLSKFAVPTPYRRGCNNNGGKVLSRRDTSGTVVPHQVNNVLFFILLSATTWLRHRPVNLWKPEGLEGDSFRVSKKHLYHTSASTVPLLIEQILFLVQKITKYWLQCMIQRLIDWLIKSHRPFKHS